MKKNGLLVLSLVLLVTLVACGSDTAPTATTEDAVQTEEPVTEETTEEVATEEAEASTDVEALDVRQVYVKPEWVKSLIDGNQPESNNYMIFHTVWGQEEDNAAYKEGHLPGAMHFDTELVETEPEWNLVKPEVMDEHLRSMGITSDKTVVLYGDPNGEAGRVAYALIWAGVNNVKILDGGLDAWKAAGYELDTESHKPTPVEDFGLTIPGRPQYWTSLQEAADRVEDADFRLVSIRSLPEWLGETSGYSYIDKAGEPKGAVYGYGGSDPSNMGDYVHEDGTVISFQEMLDLWKNQDIDIENQHLAFYCGTGWRAAIPFLLAYQEGYDNVSMYDGGWYEWQMHDELPVQVGDPASEDVIYTTVGELESNKAAE